MPGDCRPDRRTATIERHMHQVELKRQAKQFADQMRRRSDAGRRVAVFRGIGLDQLDQLFD